jgi:hypothetical protein
MTKNFTYDSGLLSLPLMKALEFTSIRHQFIPMAPFSYADVGALFRSYFKDDKVMLNSLVEI